MDTRIKSACAAGLLMVSAGAAKVAHLGPFADDVIRNLDVVAMSSIAFGDNYSAMRAGTFVEKQSVEIACSLFTSLAQTGSPPPEWTTFRGLLSDRAGVADSGEYLEGMAGRLERAVELVRVNPRTAAAYAKYCLP